MTEIKGIIPDDKTETLITPPQAVSNPFKTFFPFVSDEKPNKTTKAYTLKEYSSLVRIT